MHRRFRRWVRSAVFERLLNDLPERDLRTIMVDGCYVKLHRYGSGARRNGATREESMSGR